MWLECPGPPGGLDGLLLDRLAIATAAVVERPGPAHPTMADPILVELAPPRPRTGRPAAAIDGGS
ncbi:MAG TPA: hypothetical protein VMH35_28175 [Streptosporangiaceae bacterium]|nr:hypothetical protein [Streptosporangiaceae bacterium]